MPDFRRRYCLPSRGGCGKHDSEVGPISWGGLCRRCAHAKLADNIEGLVTMSGEPARRWRLGMAASVGAVILDDAPPRA